MSKISVSRSNVDRFVLVDGNVSLAIEVEDGFSSIKLCLEGGESLEFSRSYLPNVSALCQHALQVLWDNYPGVTQAPVPGGEALSYDDRSGVRANAEDRPHAYEHPMPQLTTPLIPKMPEGYGEPAPKPKARPGNPATEKQIGFIDNLGNALHYTEEQIVSLARSWDVAINTWDDVTKMDRAAASAMIETLKVRLDDKKAMEVEEKGVPT